jgi:hypothetical protein
MGPREAAQARCGGASTGPIHTFEKRAALAIAVLKIQIAVVMQPESVAGENHDA